MHELHLALEGAVEQLSSAQRIAAGRVDGATPSSGGEWVERIDRLLGDAVHLRNEVRDRLLNLLGRRAD